MSKFKCSGRLGKEKYFVDGKEVTKEEHDRLFEAERALLPQVEEPVDEEAAELAGLTSRPWTQPIESTAMQVHPRQVKAVLERNARHGVNIEYRENGKPVLRSRQDRNNLMRIERMRDHDAGYGDRAGR